MSNGFMQEYDKEEYTIEDKDEDAEKRNIRGGGCRGKKH